MFPSCLPVIQDNATSRISSSVSFGRNLMETLALEVWIPSFGEILLGYRQKVEKEKGGERRQEIKSKDRDREEQRERERVERRDSRGENESREGDGRE